VYVRDAATTKLAPVFGHVKVAGVFTARNVIRKMGHVRSAVVTSTKLVTSKKGKAAKTQPIRVALDVVMKKRGLVSGNVKTAGAFIVKSAILRVAHVQIVVAMSTR